MLEALEIFGVEGVVDIFLEIGAQVGLGEIEIGGGFARYCGQLAEAED